jgi:hypothetical protein
LESGRPSRPPEVAGQVKITGGAPGAGKVLTSDSAGLATWANPSVASLPGGTNAWNFTDGSGSKIYANTTNVGIGTTEPTASLEVVGQIKIAGGAPAAGMVLKSVDETGLATWEALDAAAPNPDSTNAWSKSGSNIYANATNVGIGTILPTTKLEVAGAATVASVGTVNVLQLTRPLSNMISYPQVATFSLGRYKTTDTSSPDTRLDIKLKNAVNDNIFADATIMTLQSNGNVGIGTTNPSATLEVDGQVKITGGAPGSGKVLTSDNAGLATWAALPAAASAWTVNNSNIYTNTANVGIGTTEPEVRLQISDANPLKARLKIHSLATTGGYGVDIYGNEGFAGALSVNAADKSLNLYSSGNSSVPRMTILASGYVGIGKTTPAKRLEIYETAPGQEGVLRVGNVSGYGQISAGGGALSIAATSTPNLYFWAKGATLPTMVINSAESVGIGTQTPQEKLHILGGAIRVTKTTTAAKSEIPLVYGSQYGNLSQFPNTGLAGVYHMEDGANAWGQAGALLFKTSTDDQPPVTRMTIRSDGCVGIGAPAPGEKLVVNGNISSNNYYIGSGNGNDQGSVGMLSNGPAIQFWGNSTAPLGKMFLLTSGVQRMTIDSAGKVGIGTDAPDQAAALTVIGSIKSSSITGTYNEPLYANNAGFIVRVASSRRYKYDIKPLSSDAGKVLRLEPVSFKWKKDGSKDIGLIAEDVYGLIPDLAILNKENKPESVKYDKLPVYLLKLAQDQQKQIETQQKEIESMRAEIEKLKAR